MLHCEYSWPATPEHVRDARACVTELAQRAGLSFESLEGVRLAVSEAVANVVVHGYRDGVVGPVTVAADADADRLRVVVSDEGVGICPRVDSPGAGLGLPLIAELAESISVTHGRGGRGTVLCMTFGLPQALAA